MTKIFTVPGTPIGKPRMTRSDRWKQRPCVMAYRSWADEARLAMGRTTKLRLPRATKLTVRAFFEIPLSNKRTIPGDLHTVKPDFDNVLKAVADALFENDQMIYQAVITKFWSHAGGRVEIEVDT